jgi:flavorubredoxin
MTVTAREAGTTSIKSVSSGMNDAGNCQPSGSVHWVGAVDWSVRNFRWYSKHKGIAYNAYLLSGDKKTLFVVAKKPFEIHLLHNIYQVVDTRKIDHLVMNHVGTYHSKCLPKIMEIIAGIWRFVSL